MDFSTTGAEQCPLLRSLSASLGMWSLGYNFILFVSQLLFVDASCTYYRIAQCPFLLF